MPAFQRGFSVAYLNPAPPLDPKAASLYAVAPPPEDWPATRREAYLREYNRAMLQVLTIHEAYPGHYVQLAYSNRHPSLVRKVLYSGVFAEGWAVYTEQMMLDQGYGDGDLSLRLHQLKFYIRAVLNAILDHKMHCADMTDEEALKLLMERGFQTEGEAVGKVLRAKQSSTQLSTYFVGRMAFYRLRQQVQRKRGDELRPGQVPRGGAEPGDDPGEVPAGVGQVGSGRVFEARPSSGPQYRSRWASKTRPDPTGRPGPRSGRRSRCLSPSLKRFPRERQRGQVRRDRRPRAVLGPGAGEVVVVAGQFHQPVGQHRVRISTRRSRSSSRHFAAGPATAARRAIPTTPPARIRTAARQVCRLRSSIRSPAEAVRVGDLRRLPRVDLTPAASTGSAAQSGDTGQPVDSRAAVQGRRRSPARSASRGPGTRPAARCVPGQAGWRRAPARSSAAARGRPRTRRSTPPATRSRRGTPAAAAGGRAGEPEQVARRAPASRRGCRPSRRRSPPIPVASGASHSTRIGSIGVRVP